MTNTGIISLTLLCLILSGLILWAAITLAPRSWLHPQTITDWGDLRHDR